MKEPGLRSVVNIKLEPDSRRTRGELDESELRSCFGMHDVCSPNTTHGTAIHAYIRMVWGVNVGIHGVYG